MTDNAERPLIVGVMGGADATDDVARKACELGALIAGQGWILLNGGRDAGIMAASARGAAEAGGITVGILPDTDSRHAARNIQIAICTGMGSARNVINVLSSDVVVACPGGAGTLSEIALALKHGKTVITMDFDTKGLFADFIRNGRLIELDSPAEIVARIRQIQASKNR